MKLNTIKRLAVTTTLILAGFAWGTASADSDLTAAGQKTYYQKQVERQITICQSKNTLQFSRLEGLREMGRKYGLKLAYLSRQQEQLVDEMIRQKVAAKPYRVSRFITADFYKTLEEHEMKLASR